MTFPSRRDLCKDTGQTLTWLDNQPEPDYLRQIMYESPCSGTSLYLSGARPS
jgi:hypothetical protein